MKKTYYIRQYSGNKFIGQRLVGKQLKRAEKSAETSLFNQLIDKVEIITYLNGETFTVVKSILRKK